MNERKLILISNDDGVCAEGLQLLVEAVKPLAHVVVLAPEEQQSGKSSSISSCGTLALRCVSREPGVEVYAASGTPTDCVKLAFYTVCKDRMPDLLLSGINKGSNSSISVIYSGTMGAAFEGCVAGIPSVGLSQCFVPGEPVCYTHALPLVRQLVDDLLQGRVALPLGVCLNVNFPHGPVEGPLEWCRQSRGRWVNEFLATGETTPGGHPLFTLGGDFECRDLQPGTDEYALAHHRASCVPQTLDMTDYKFLNNIKNR